MKDWKLLHQKLWSEVELWNQLAECNRKQIVRFTKDDFEAENWNLFLGEKEFLLSQLRPLQEEIIALQSERMENPVPEALQAEIHSYLAEVQRRKELIQKQEIEIEKQKEEVFRLEKQKIKEFRDKKNLQSSYQPPSEREESVFLDWKH